MEYDRTILSTLEIRLFRSYLSLFHVLVSFSGVADGGQFDDSVRHGENVENDNGTLYDIENGADVPSVGEISEKKDCVDDHQKKSRVNAVRER